MCKKIKLNISFDVVTRMQQVISKMITWKWSEEIEARETIPRLLCSNVHLPISWVQSKCTTTYHKRMTRRKALLSTERNDVTATVASPTVAPTASTRAIQFYWKRDDLSIFALLFISISSFGCRMRWRHHFYQCFCTWSRFSSSSLTAHTQSSDSSENWSI